MEKRIEYLKEVKRVTELELDFINGEIEKATKKQQGINITLDEVIGQATKYAEMRVAMENLASR